MVKHFNVIMAGVISGIVALFTSFLGISGTIIGSVLSSFLYQLLSAYYEEKVDETPLRKPKLANEIVYIFPLVVIGIIELIFLLSALHYRFDMLFDILESAVANNLFRLMGIGLILLGAYPFFNSNDIDKRNGLVLFVVGLLLLLRGLMDISEITSKIFYMIFAPFDMIFALIVVLAIGLVIFNILISNTGLFKSSEFINSHRPKKPHARKIDTSAISKKYGPGNIGKGNVGIDVHKPKAHKINDDYANNHAVGSNNPNIGSAPGHIESDNHSEEPDIGSKDSNQENLPLYEEEVILVNNPEDPDNPIKKRILKRIKSDDDVDDGYQDLYIIDESE